MVRSSQRRLSAFLLLVVSIAAPAQGGAITYYVRQTVGNDAHAGTSPQTAWQHVSLLSKAMRHGDTAYVGPGLYRESIQIRNRSDAGDEPLTIVADVMGEHTTDPPGDVTIAGSDVIDEGIFAAHSNAGIFAARVPGPVLGVVEIDNEHRRYTQSERAIEPAAAIDFVTATPASFFYDEANQLLYLHTSDNKAPSTHEIEIIRRADDISVVASPRVIVIGFTLRDAAHAGIRFWNRADRGAAIGNAAFGHHQGIEVYDSHDVLVSGNMLFGNQNSGVYFLAGSMNGIAVDNVAYGNAKGLRWGSRSTDGVAIDNDLSDNSERGIAIENADGALLRRNRLSKNGTSHLLVYQSSYDSDANCFTGDSNASIADFSSSARYATLAEYQKLERQDLTSSSGDCGTPPAAQGGVSAAQRKPKSPSR